MKNNKYLYTLLLVILGISSSQDVFEGYTLFTPQIGIGGGATTYLMDNGYNIIQYNRTPSLMILRILSILQLFRFK